MPGVLEARRGFAGVHLHAADNITLHHLRFATRA
jgi:hypothetical protein